MSRPIAVAITVVAASLVASAAYADVTFGPHDVPTIFFIDKSDDRNRVDYGIRLRADCTPASSSPMEVYWREFEGTSAGRVTHGLNIFEGPAYGVRRQTVVSSAPTETWLEIELTALSTRPIRIRVRRIGGRCLAEAYAAIDGSEARLTSVHLTLGGPGSIDYLDLIGIRPDGSAARERMRP